MKKHLLTTLCAVIVIVLGAATATAETQVVKSWDFVQIGKANADKTPFTTFCDGTIKAGSTACDLGTGIIDGLFAQGGGSWLFRSAGSLYQGNGGGRIFGINNLKAGDVVTIKTNGDYFTGITNAESAYGDNTYTWTVTADGMVYGSLARYNYIYSVTVEREVSDKPYDPIGRIVAVNGNARTIELTCETPDVEIRYTTDETEPTAESTLYTDGIVIEQNTTIKAIAIKDGNQSDTYTATFEAGYTIALEAPTYWVSAMTIAEDNYFATYDASCSNANVLCKPAISLAATFNGNAVDLPYAATETGTLVVVASAAGYDDAKIEVAVKAYAVALEYNFKDILPTQVNNAMWGQPETGKLADKWTAMDEETIHYTVQADSLLSQVFPGLTLSTLKGTVYPALYIDFGIIWPGTAANYGTVTVDNDEVEIIEVTTNGSYGKVLSTWYEVGNVVSIYRYDTALEALKAYAPKEPTGVGSVSVEAQDNAPAYDIMGRPVTPGYRGIVIKGGKKYYQR